VDQSCGNLISTWRKVSSFPKEELRISDLMCHQLKLRYPNELFHSRQFIYKRRSHYLDVKIELKLQLSLEQFLPIFLDVQWQNIRPIFAQHEPTPSAYFYYFTR